MTFFYNRNISEHMVCTQSSKRCDCWSRNMLLPFIVHIYLYYMITHCALFLSISQTDRQTQTHTDTDTHIVHRTLILPTDITNMTGSSEYSQDFCFIQVTSFINLTLSMCLLIIHTPQLVSCFVFLCLPKCIYQPLCRISYRVSL